MLTITRFVLCAAVLMLAWAQLLFAQSHSPVRTSSDSDADTIRMYIPLDTLREYEYAEDPDDRKTMRIGESRMLYGHIWYRMYIPGRTITADGWYRNDSDGLHSLRDTANGMLVDRLLIPAVVRRHEALRDGELIDTGSIAHGGVIRRTVTVRYGTRGTITWADSLGIYAMTDRSYRYLLLHTGGYRNPVLDVQPAEFQLPYGPGDILVYKVTPEQSNRVLHSKAFIVASRAHGSTARVETWCINAKYHPMFWISTYDYYEMFVDASNFITLYGRERMQMYPAYIPKGKEVLLNNTIWDVVRTLDTTVFGMPTKAYHIKRKNMQFIVSDRFGELFAQEDDFILTLNSAVLRDTLYNRDTTRREYLPLCVGNRYVYRHEEDERNIDELVTSTITADTMIAGRRYYRFSGWGPLRGLLRSDESGVYQYNANGDLCLIQSDASLGSMTPSGFVSDTSTRTDRGVPRFYVLHNYVITDHSTHREWLEGIGLLSDHFWGYGGGSKNYSLVHAIVCGVEYGTPVAVDAPAALPERVEITSIQPHPVTSDGTMRFRLSHDGYVQLELMDYLGRQVGLLHDGDLRQGSHRVAISIKGLQSGLYFAVLRSGAAVSVHKVIVQH
ncbi:MAG: T9SS type A sorting domain-containing protein [Bacteroidia bacterium]|nr:T9SS type A sorting domain-containing protein [Bacteroidia bacterium]